MAIPKIGYDYRLSIGGDLYDDPIAWVNNSSKRLYATWGEIDTEIVKVKAKTQVISTYYIVALLNRLKDPFYASKNLLIELTRRLPIPCKCDLQCLINRGCRCGAFEKEQKEKN